MPIDDAAAEPQPLAPGRGVQRILLKRQDFVDHDLTEGCPKCDAAKKYGWGQWGSSNKSHSERCRLRMEEELKKSVDGRRRLDEARLREDRWLARQVELADRRPEVEDGHDDLAARERPQEADIPVLRDQEAVWPSSGHPEEGESDPAPISPSSQMPSTPQAPIGEDVFYPDSDPEDEKPTETHGDVEMDHVLKIVQEDFADEVVRTDVEICRLVRDLGGHVPSYRRERKKMLTRIVSEVYSKPRVTAAIKMLPSLKLVPGMALDLTTEDENGDPWNFAYADRRAEARRRLAEQRPVLVIGSPACTEFCTWKALHNVKRKPEETRRAQAEAEVHLRFVAELYRDQVEAGRYFLHEHPSTASSWSLPCIREVLDLPGVEKVDGDQCQLGQEDVHGDPLKKPTGWMSNSEEILYALSKRCQGRRGFCSRPGGGKHGSTSGQHSRRAAVYPFKLCKAILMGIRNQLREDGCYTVGVVGFTPWRPERLSDAQALRKAARDHALVFEYDDVEISPAEVYGAKVVLDDITGQPLRWELVQEARRKELDYFNAKKVWEKRRRAEALAVTGRQPISVRWVDVNKGDDDHPDYRSRLVAREIRRKGEEPIFAPSPPLESLRLIVSMAATDLPGGPRHVRDPLSPQRTQISLIDITRAYFWAETDPEDPTYVALPSEDADHERGMCGLLKRHMYGTKAAADGWHTEMASTLSDFGFEVGDASACVFVHPDRRLKCSCHGDDLTTCGPKDALDWFKQRLEEKYELKEGARLGPGPDDDKTGRVLNRILHWTPDGITYEADPRQVEKLLRDLKLEGSKAVATPGTKASFEQLAADKLLPEEKVSPYRAVAARANYLAADRPDVQFSAKEVCRWMSAPTEHGLMSLKRLGRFLEGKRRLVYHYPWQSCSHVDVYSDTDWGGCPRTRKSTSGGCLMLGKHLVKSWSSTQISPSLSSGEAEFYGVVKAAGIGLGFQALLSDVDVSLPVRVWTDSTATMGICGRQGLGKLRHIHTQCLWVQQRVRDGSVELRKVRGDSNPADVFTKHLLSGDKIQSLLRLFGCHYADGRPAAAPALRQGAGTQKGELLTVLAQGEMQEEVQWHGLTFPKCVWDPGDGTDKVELPEAYEYPMLLLPHEVPHHDRLFPRAYAVSERGDVDPAEDSAWERRGVGVGQAKGRGRRKV